MQGPAQCEVLRFGSRNNPVRIGRYRTFRLSIKAHDISPFRGEPLTRPQRERGVRPDVEILLGFMLDQLYQVFLIEVPEHVLEAVFDHG